MMQPVTTWDELCAMLPPCPVCGEAYKLDELQEHEKRECVDRHNSLIQTPQGLAIAAHVMGVTFHCDECLRKSDWDRKETARKRKAETLRIEIYGKKLLPEAAKRQTFDHSNRDFEIRNSPAWHELQRWTPRSNNLWITGPEGTGKTYGARCVLNKQIDFGHTVAELSAFDLCSNSKLWNVRDLIAPFIEADVLLLEDIDKGPWDAKAIEFAWHILDKRQGTGKRVIITANVTAESLKMMWLPLLQSNPTIIETFFVRLLPTTRVSMLGESIRREVAKGEQAQQQEVMAL